MNEDRLNNGALSPRREMPTSRQLSRLEILTAVNVEPALKAMLSCMEWLDGRVRIVCERDGSVLASGQGFKDWLERSKCLTLFESKLKTTNHSEQIKLERLLGVPTTEIVTVILARSRTGGHCIVRGAGLCGEALAVTMQIADDTFQPNLADLHEAFGLTPSEMHVVEMLQQGLGAIEICEQLGISVHTVRAHLRHCYDKLGVSSREELWQKLAPYRLN